MTFTDSPDWQEVAVTVTATGDMPDAPDWQRTVVGPGGTPSGGGGGAAAQPAFYLPPSFVGVKAWTCDPASCGQSFPLSTAEVTYSALAVADTVTVSDVIGWVIGADGSGFSGTGQVAIYEAASSNITVASEWTLVAETSPTTSLALWNAVTTLSGLITIPLLSSVSLNAGSLYYVGANLQTVNSEAVAYRPTQTLGPITMVGYAGADTAFSGVYPTTYPSGKITAAAAAQWFGVA